MKFAFLLFQLLFVFVSKAYVQDAGGPFSIYRAAIHRPDNNEISFTILESMKNGKRYWIIRNAAERIPLHVRVVGDSLFAEFPVFESRLHFHLSHQDVDEGLWFKGSQAGYNTQPVTLYRNQHDRFGENIKPARHIISGRWAVSFRRGDGSTRPAIAEFKQEGSMVTGTFITPSGDYRYLDGIVSGDSLQLSTFDGSHAFYFRAYIETDRKISGGLYCSGTAHKETWSAIKDENASLPGDPSKPRFTTAARKLNFSFPDLRGKMISINDPEFKNKVVVIQLMGSWCSNCMDETAFLSNFYRQNKSKGVAMIALAYEYSTDRERSRKSLSKFQQRFHVEYPILITGVTSSDSLRTKKTLPQLERLEDFPTTLFLDKSGRVRQIHTGFNGPATGAHYDEEKKYFQKEVDGLLAE